MYAVFATIYLILDVLWFFVIVSAILSWLLAFGVVNRHNQVVGTIWQILNSVTEPLLRPIRSILPHINGIDLSPILLLIAIFFVRTFLQTSVQPMFF